MQKARNKAIHIVNIKHEHIIDKSTSSKQSQIESDLVQNLPENNSLSGESESGGNYSIISSISNSSPALHSASSSSDVYLSDSQFGSLS